MNDASPPPPAPSALCIGMWQLLLAGHAAAAVAWWWLQPGGFPLVHVRTLTNVVAPLIVAVGAVAGMWALARRKQTLASTLVAAVPAFWVALVVAACVTFPISMRRFGLVGLGFIAATGGAWWYLSPTGEQIAKSHRWILAVAAVLGCLLPPCIRGEAPSTQPLNVTPPDLLHVPGGTEKVEAVTRGEHVHISPTTAEVIFSADGVTIEVQPLLTFDSRSTDRCWTLFASDADRKGPERQLVGRQSIDDVALLRYLDDGAHVLRVRSRQESTSCEIEGFSSLPRPVYSHLNTFCKLMIHSRRDLRLTFSPCPDTPIAGRQLDLHGKSPAQFAYLRDDGALVIAEAQAAEKGPFRTVAEGPLGRDGALELRIESDGRRVVTIRFDDWAAQASTELSPTAGWGVPQNAVEFQRDPSLLDTTVDFWITLAATSVGRGFDSVGHKAGTYRNRVRIEAGPR